MPVQQISNYLRKGLVEITITHLKLDQTIKVLQRSSKIIQTLYIFFLLLFNY